MSYRKLSDDARRTVRQAAASGTPLLEIAGAHGIPYSTVWATVNEEAHLLAQIRSARRRLKKLRAERAAGTTEVTGVRPTCPSSSVA